MKFGMEGEVVAINLDHRLFMMTSLFLPDMLHTDKHLHFLSLVAYHSGIWYLGPYFVAYWLHCIKKGKKRAMDQIIMTSSI